MRDSERLKRFRKSKKTYSGIAAEVGVNMTSVRDAVRGETKRPRPELAAAIAEAIGLPVVQVFPALAEQAA